ncbi:DUF4274 domain-containing protein [Paenibacillus puldeungensis]|uniref:DUF4274 domain-containing protein n=1 Tax=Paenibacillus puldeungensis TaxID=696536 RepID=A0ABW3RVC8_9BACL
MNWVEVSKSKNLAVVREAISELDVNERDDRGRTPLMLFLTNRMPVEAIELLIHQGADLEAEDKLGDTALRKAVKFKQKEAMLMLIEAGAKLDSPHGILSTAWNLARGNKEIADLLLGTTGAVRLTLTGQEHEVVDGILYEESMKKMCEQIRCLDSPVLLHAVVNEYNWDDGPEPMLQAFRNPSILDITLHDMYDLLDGNYWLQKEATELENRLYGVHWLELALGIKKRLEGADY